VADNKGNELKPMDFDCLIISQMKLARLAVVVDSSKILSAAAKHFFWREPK
jgi:hypothetical protein